MADNQPFYRTRRTLKINFEINRNKKPIRVRIIVVERLLIVIITFQVLVVVNTYLC